MNALELLRGQHEELRVSCAKLRETKTRDARRRAVAALARLLRSHTLLEEEQLYPALEADEETAELADVAFRDHEQLDEVVAELERCPLDDPGLPAIVDELEELLEEHLELEEGRLLPRLAALWPPARQLEVGRAMAARFAELTASAERALGPERG